MGEISLYRDSVKVQCFGITIVIGGTTADASKKLSGDYQGVSPSPSDIYKEIPPSYGHYCFAVGGS